MNKRLKYQLLSLFALISLCFLLFTNCKKQQDYERLQSALQKAQFDASNFHQELTDANERISTQQQLILTQKEAIESGLLEIDRLKNVKSQVRFVTQTKIDTIFADFVTPIDTNQERNNIDRFKVTDPWYSFEGYVMPVGVAITDLQIKNEYSLTIADKKLGFFKTPEPSVILINKNPYTYTEEMQNIVIVKKERFYRKPWFWTSVGVGVGLYINRN